MHEMSIALDILRSVEETSRQHSATDVTRIRVEVGALAGIFVSALDFCLDVAKRNTIAESAEIQIDEIAGTGQCPLCKTVVPLQTLHTVCPKCSDAFVSVTSGNELRILDIEIERAN